MTKTKHSLLMSAIALLLCCSMLIGSTFAWFTDSVTSTNNKIQSGTLKVDLELLEKGGTWTSIKNSGKALFDYDKWEPGYTEVKILKIENEGTLALKWVAQFVSEKALSKLANVIDVYVTTEALTTYPAEREVVSKWTKVGTVAEFVNTIEQTTNGTLNAKGTEGDTAYLGIALKMREEANNDYQGLDLGGAFDIRIFATQKDYEPDSFGDDYDAGLDNGKDGISRTLDDGSTVIFYNEESPYYGRVRLTAIPENIGTEYVVPSEVNDLGGKLVGITLDKLTVPAGIKYAYKSLDGATIDEIVVADGATTIPNRMFYKTNVESVVIPDGVTIIEQNAFAQTSGVEELVIPASVTTVEEAAFQHMSDLTTVTFEGNTAIQGYAFRGCSELKTVYLKGDDVTFVPSTLNGRDSCWFCNGESNNPNTSDITFYVQNETVAARVRTAMGAEADNTTIYIGMPTTANDAAELKNALNNGESVIVLADDIELTDTLMAKKDAVIDLNGKTITAPSNSAMFQSSSDFEPSMIITSSVVGAEINAGSNAVLLGYGSTEISNVTINVENATSTSVPFSVYGDLTLGEGTVVNVNKLGTSLISNNGAVAIVIDGAEINVGEFKVNGSQLITLNKASTLEMKNTDMKIDNYVLSRFGGEGLVNKIDGVTIENCTFDVTDSNGASCTFVADAEKGRYNLVQE